MNKLSSYLRPAYLLCLLGVAHCLNVRQAAPLVASAKGSTSGKASLLRRPATNLGRTTQSVATVTYR
jgi:hypothetical protein